MIHSVSNSTPATDQTEAAATQNPAVVETPFGDVLASQITGIDLQAWLAESNSGVASTPGGAATPGPAATSNSASRDQAALNSTHTVKPIRSRDNSTPTSNTAAAGSGTQTTTPSPNSVPTVKSVFGSTPWMSDPTGSGNGVTWNYNPIYFATEQTAETVAQMLGGTVVETNAITSAPVSPLQQNEPNYMVEFSSGAEVNPGLVADLYNHGYSQSYINQELSAIQQGS